MNRTSSEPPSHLECARFSARTCPFLTQPRMKRVGEANLPAGVSKPAGQMIHRNPGVTLVWQTLRPSRWEDSPGRYLFDIGKPHAVEWYANGRAATREEVLESIGTGLPLLEAMCEQDPDRSAAFRELERRTEDALALVPA